MNRRSFLASTVAIGTGTSLGIGLGSDNEAAAASKKTFEISLTEAQWREKLTAEQFRVLRKHGTERAGSSPLDKEERVGTFHCAGCEQPLYRSETKFDSRTGWPSFWAAIDGKTGTSIDYKLIYPRTEVHCSRCGGHLGHIFRDGPKPTGKRHCINGVAMTFRPDEVQNG